MKIEVRDPKLIMQIAQRIYFFGSLISIDLFFGFDFAWYLFFWVSPKMSGPSPLSYTS